MVVGVNVGVGAGASGEGRHAAVSSNAVALMQARAGRDSFATRAIL
jgi:hypothetical protein